MSNAIQLKFLNLIPQVIYSRSSWGFSSTHSAKRWKCNLNCFTQTHIEPVPFSFFQNLDFNSVSKPVSAKSRIFWLKAFLYGEPEIVKLVEVHTINLTIFNKSHQMEGQCRNLCCQINHRFVEVCILESCSIPLPNIQDLRKLFVQSNLRNLYVMTYNWLHEESVFSLCFFNTLHALIIAVSV